MRVLGALVSVCLASTRKPRYAPCVGSSSGLPAKECNAWQDFFDATQGPSWANFGSDGRLNPCSVKSKIGKPCNPPLSEEAWSLIPRPTFVKGAKPPPWQEPDAGVCCENNHITQLAFGINGLEGEIVSTLSKSKCQ
jgi:hypothetical protein